MDVKNPPIGNNILDDEKSNRLNIVIAKILKSLNGPKLRAHIPDKRNTIKIITVVALILDQLNFSQQNEMEISARLIVEVSDAMKRRIKKRNARTAPPGRAPKIEGNTSNTRVGPA